MNLKKHLLTTLLLAGTSAYAGDVSVNMPGISVNANQNTGSNANVSVKVPGTSVSAVQSNSGGKQAERADVLRMTGNDMSKSTQCNGQPVYIQGNGNQISLTGSCPQVRVNGNENQVTVAQLGKVQVVGNDNQVKWAQALNGQEPQVQTSGNDNQVSRR